MLFTEPRFALFFLVCFTLRWLLPGYGLQKSFLLASSYVFYGAWDWRFLFLLAGCTLTDYWIGRAIGAASTQRVRRAWLVASLVSNLGVLGLFKYFNFFVSSGASLLTWLGLAVSAHTLEIVLPVGLSFFTFQSISYVMDVYRGQLAPMRNFRDYAMFVSFFPQLVAGPIVRASDFLPQLERPPLFADVQFRRCLALVFVGYFKKACIADNIAAVIDPVFAGPSGYGPGDVLLAAVGYSIQIYCDFSGYTDMAIGIAGMLGYRLALNFDAPYLSTNIRDFWRRWHMSLSSWLRDYLYIPLGGGRGSSARVYANLMITMGLGGLWHGANMTFVLWGLLHGFALCAYRALSASGRGARLVGWPGAALFGWLVTFVWVVGCFALFRCPNLETFVSLLGQLGAAEAGSHLRSSLWLLFAVLGGVHLAVRRLRAPLGGLVLQAPAPVFGFALGVASGVALFFTPVSSAPFIYFQF